MLYIPPAFRETDMAALQAQMAASGLATLITVGAEGPIVSNLPLVFDASAGANGTLTGHIARGNPQWKDSNLALPALALFAGDNAYVSPSWYPSKQEHGKVVPTWNYSLIAARGRLEIFEDAETLRENVEKITKRFENRFAHPWEVADAPEDFIARQLKGIVGVKLVIEAIEGKAKLSQNRTPADQKSVMEALGGSTNPSEQAVAAAMKARQGG